MNDCNLMKITILGSGTSMGVPTVACECPVCLSEDPHDKRLRAGIWIQVNGKSILVDASVDFRQQALTHHINDVDAVLITHTHSDHVAGIDDLRIYNMIHHKKIEIYGRHEDLDEIRHRFHYCFNPVQIGGGITQMDLKPVEDVFEVCGLRATPIPVKHGILDIYGYRIGRFAVVTDASHISDQSIEMLQGVDVLLINALRPEPHETHFSLGQALEASRKIRARQTYFTHMCHRLGHRQTNSRLPPEAQLAYDGLSFEISTPQNLT